LWIGKTKEAISPINMWPGQQDWAGLDETTSLLMKNLDPEFVWSLSSLTFPLQPIPLLRETAALVGLAYRSVRQGRSQTGRKISITFDVTNN
jgi:hypothetical protein